MNSHQRTQEYIKGKSPCEKLNLHSLLVTWPWDACVIAQEVTRQMGKWQMGRTSVAVVDRLKTES